MNRIFCVMEYVCPKTWESLIVTARDDIRLCNHCNKKVYLCASQEEVDSAAELGKCVAFDSAKQATPTDTPVDGETLNLTRRTVGLPSSYMSAEGKNKFSQFVNQDLTDLIKLEEKNDSK